VQDANLEEQLEPDPGKGTPLHPGLRYKQPGAPGFAVPVTEAVRALLGHRVRVRLADAVIVTGQLLGFGDGGDFEILCEDGMVHYCWPMLSIEAAS
jgi:hypothetical protein